MAPIQEAASDESFLMSAHSERASLCVLCSDSQVNSSDTYSESIAKIDPSQS